MDSLIDYLYKTTDFNLFMLLSFFFVSLSILALFFIKWFMPLSLRYQENAVIGCTSALISIIYGVLAGFATLYLIDNNNNASDAVQHEANAMASIYRESRLLNEPVRTAIQKDVKRYLDHVLNVEWPQMNNGETISNVGDALITQTVEDLNIYKSADFSESLVLNDILELSRNLYDARQQRIQLSYTSLSNEVWVAIVIGTVLTLCVSYLFGINFRLHIFIAVSAALMTASIIFLLISLDKPFQGDFVVGPEQFESLLDYFNKH